MLLIDYINEEYGGNYAAFATVIGKHRNQIDRYIKSGALWHEGRVWLAAK